MSEIIRNLEKLSAIPGVSGGEGLVRAGIIQMIDGHCEHETDALGNLIAFKKGKKAPKNRVMFSAHMDEVGLIITLIEDSGLLRFANVGGIDSRVIVGKSVLIGEKQVFGLIGAKALHQLEDKEKEEPLSPDKLYIDIGASDKAEAEEHVRPGDRAVFSAKFLPLGGERVMGRAFDDRAGCALLIDMICSELEYDCFFAFTVQEETGCVGGATAAYRIDPDISIVVEATTAADIAGVDPGKQVCAQGRGPVFSFMDKGTVYDAALYRLALGVAENNSIPCQPKQGVFGGNESRAIQKSRAGARTLAISLPCRYIHSANNVLHTGDIAHSAALLRALVPALGEWEAGA